MRFLRHPVTIALLVAAAVAVFAWPTIKARWAHFHAAPAAAPAADANAPASGTNTEDEIPVFPGVNIDRAYGAANLAGWCETPGRDPFLMAEPAPPPELPSNLTLKAIWRQGGVSLAAIDQGIYRLGDRIGGYRVVSIDDRGVVLESNDRGVAPDERQRTLLGFATPESKPSARAKEEQERQRLAKFHRVRHPVAAVTNAPVAEVTGAPTNGVTGMATSALIKATSQEASAIDAAMKAANN